MANKNCGKEQPVYNKSGLKNRIKQSLKSKQGMTLVELVVTFALLALFATSTCMMLSTAIRVYHQIRGLNNARQVCDTLMDKITGQIEGAQVGVPTGETAGQKKTLKIYKDGSVIELYDRTGSHIAITTTDHYDGIQGVEVPGKYNPDVDQNQMVIYYYPVLSQSGSASEENRQTRYAAVDWLYDKAAYMGFEIKSLKFYWVAPDGVDYNKNVFKVELELTSPQYGSFKSTRYLECYNFTKNTDFTYITEE